MKTKIFNPVALPLPPFRQGGYLRSMPSTVKLALLSLLLGAGTAFAAAPAALTNIGNTASASFVDSGGKPNIVTSNPVVTVVQQVGAFTLDNVATAVGTVVNTKTGTAGGTLYAPHVLTNTGNGPDSFTISVASEKSQFSKIEIFADDGGGNPVGAPLCSSSATPAVCNVTTPVSVAGSNGTFKFVVAYTIPPTASGTVLAYDTALVSVKPITASLPMYAAPLVTAKDNVNLTTGAAFTMGKSISIPAVSPPSGAWPTAAVGGKASTSAACATTWGSGLASSANCIYTVYTLTFSNIGAAAGRFALADTLPSGLTYVAGSAVWSNSAGRALTEAVGGDGAAIDFAYVSSSRKITAVVTSVSPSATQTLSFVVLVNNAASAGGAATTNIAYYNPNTADPGTNSGDPGLLVTPTGSVPYTVYGTYRVALGSRTSTSANAADATPGTPNIGTDDTTTVASAVAGSIVKFEQKVYNLGDTVDTVNLAINPNTFPSGTTFFLFASDGATPLYDTGVLDGVLDTGPIAPGGSATVVVAAFLPAGLTVGPANFRAILTGTSRNDPLQKDATADVLTSVSNGLVDLTNTASGNGTAGATGDGDVGPGPSPAPTTIKTTTPGVATSFNLFIANNDTVARTYTLAASASPGFPGNLPANWTIKFVEGANGSCAAASPAITQAVAVPPATQTAVTACVTPGPQQTPVTAAKVYFKVVATTATAEGLFANDTKTDAVTIVPAAGVSYAATLVGNNSGELASPGTVVCSHILTNTGIEQCGPYNLQVTLRGAEAAAGWTFAVYLDQDGNGSINDGDTLVTGPVATPLLPGAANAQKILVRIGAPGGLPVGSTGLATVTAMFAPGATSCGTPSAVDLSTITTGSIRVYKTQAPDLTCRGIADGPLGTANLTLKPGSCIYYHVTAVNEGVAPITNLVIHDTAPAYTQFSPLQPAPAVVCTATNVTGVMPLRVDVGRAVSCGSSGNVGNPGGGVSLDYTVVIDK